MSYSFHRTEDAALIKSVLCHPAVYRKLHDDYAPPREEWEPLLGNPMIQYFAVSDDHGKVIGMFHCGLHSACEVEIHTAFLPCAWGRDVRPAADQFRAWLWREFPDVQRIIGKVIPSNRASVQYAEALGFKMFGVDEKSCMSGGVLQDQFYFGMSRP